MGVATGVCIATGVGVATGVGTAAGVGVAAEVSTWSGPVQREVVLCVKLQCRYGLHIWMSRQQVSARYQMWIGTSMWDAFL